MSEENDHKLTFVEEQCSACDVPLIWLHTSVHAIINYEVSKGLRDLRASVYLSKNNISKSMPERLVLCFIEVIFLERTLSEYVASVLSQL